MAQSNADPNELFLMKLRYKHGRLIPAGSKNPVLLADEQMAWVVFKGWVDVFAVPTMNGALSGARTHLFRCEVGQFLCGLPAIDDSQGLVLLAVGGPEAQLLELPRSAIERLSTAANATEEEITLVAELLTQWVGGLSAGLGGSGSPKSSEFLQPGETALEAGQFVGARQVLWLRHLDGNSDYLGIRGLALPQAKFTPLTPHTWLRVTQPGTIQALDSLAVVRQLDEWAMLDTFHNLALTALLRKLNKIDEDERQRLRAKADAGQRYVDQAFRRLTAVLTQPDETISATTTTMARPNPLLAACQVVSNVLSVPISVPPDSRLGRGAGYDPLRAIARASHLRYRKVALRGEWWREDHGPLVAFTRPLKEPARGESTYAIEWERAVALIPISDHAYEMNEPIVERRTRVTPEVAASLAPFAYELYRPLPEQAATMGDLLRFGLVGCRNDLLMVLWMGLGVGLLGTFTPLATSALFNTIIPSGSTLQLVQIGLALLVAAFGFTAFNITRNIALLRIEGRVGASLQAATWDRVLRLPPTFFRLYPAGDLADRAIGVETIRIVIFRNVITAFLAGIFSLFNFFLLFYYSRSLALLATGLVLLAGLAATSIGVGQVRSQRTLTALKGEISGLVLQFISGIPKFRVAGVEGWAFTRWAKKFSQQKRAAYHVRMLENTLVTFNAVYPLMALMALMAVMTFVTRGEARPTTGTFLGFYAAFVQFLHAVLAISSAVVTSLSVVPLFERARPILETFPEVNTLKNDPGELSGALEVHHLTFRYKPDEPPVLDDVSISAHAGEFIALVGPSGSGKSTLLRLLLGFETPAAGAIYMDGQDLASLDIEAVRRQMGVVLQDGKLFAGDLLSNILGSLPLTVDDAWEAARMVGMDEDIRQMPMGMNTLVSEGGGNLSGGQRQRVLIARAVVSRPRLLFFDEATSALDNQTQFVVSTSLERLRATRIVIAHRLSTIQNADRIYVLQKGRVVQSGNYQQLLKEGGVFGELVRRQIA
jgi:NHLM bacteriocin system ABC transporter ATP-binding protein